MLNGGIAEKLLPRMPLYLAEEAPGGGGGGKVTQEEVNKYYKLYKEGSEKIEVLVNKLNLAEGEKVDLVGRIKKLEDDKKPPVYVPPEDGLPKVYTEEDPPQTEQEWNDYFDSNPNAAHELKAKVGTRQNSWRQERVKSAKDLQEKHPDMYFRNEDGSLKKYKVDISGNYVKAGGQLVLDPAGVPHVDEKSEKGKIWMDLANDPNFLSSAKAPTIIMGAMENKLRVRKDKDMEDKLEKDKKDKEIKRVKKVDNADVAGGGGEPPAEKPKVEIKYNSKEEEAHVKRQVDKGFYKSEEQYFQIKGSGQEIPAGRGGF